jgi:hypothetical protein
MASKMPAALDRENTRITINMAERGEWQKPLKCEFCDIPVVFVNAHSRTVGDDIILVEACFRRKGRYEHKEICKYNVHSQITIIASESEGDIIKAIQGNRYELRLMAVTRAIDQIRELDKKKKDSQSEVVSGTTEKNYIAKQKKRLGAYINSAQRVLKVRAACAKHSEIEEVLDLVFDGVRLPWRDFYFEDKNYFRCFRQVTNATVKVPVAIKGTIKEKKVVPCRTGKCAVIDLVRPYQETDQEVRDYACFSIWSPDLGAFESYEECGEILAFGIWESRGIKESPNKNKDSPIKVFRNHELWLWPVTKSQIEYRKVGGRTKRVLNLKRGH